MKIKLINIFIDLIFFTLTLIFLIFIIFFLLNLFIIDYNFYYKEFKNQPFYPPFFLYLF